MFAVLLAAALAAVQAPAAHRAGTSGTPASALRILADNCLQCHGAGKSGGLDLRSRASALRGSAHGPVITPGRPDASRLLKMVSGSTPAMPPMRRISDPEIAVLRRWVSEGAQYPSSITVEDLRHWSFRPITRQTVPAVRQAAFVRNPIDAFLLQRMEQAGVVPNPTADRRTLLRRVTFGLLGLPPTPEELDAFERDRRPDAWERVVDRLLSSPHYGERMARHWLDLARFAESEGFKADEIRPNAWRYRDYVVQAFNADTPYDRFVKEQIAGDELYPDDIPAQIATGFNRHWADESNARNLLLRRQEILNDITDVTATVVLGLTLGCARCHDHKYDPIPQKDYYRLQAYFAAVQPRDDIPLLTARQRDELTERQQRWEDATRTLRSRIDDVERETRARLAADKLAKMAPETRAAVAKPSDSRTPLEWQLVRKAQPQITVTSEEVGKALKGDEKIHWTRLQHELAQFGPPPNTQYQTAIGITDIGPAAPPTHTLSVGLYSQPIAEVACGVPAALSAPQPPQPQPGRDTTGRRSALAVWLTSPSNPLTARVMVNRLWQMHFGRGIVDTPNDFGNTGGRPTHPELLDWLAGEFIRRGWSIKQIHRLILTSRAYQMSCSITPRSSSRDKQNTLWWRQERRRLEGEAVRDAILCTSGRLNTQMGGRGVFAELPAGLTTRGYWQEDPDVRQRERRSLYIFVKRNLRYPLFAAFDFPDTHEPCARRETTVTAPQALNLLNDSVVVQQARHFAARLLREAGTDTTHQVERAWLLALGRKPEPAEKQISLGFLQTQTSLLLQCGAEKGPLVLPYNASWTIDRAAGAALVDFCQMLMNTNEFLFVD